MKNNKKTKFTMDIFFASDDNFAIYLTAAIASILISSCRFDYHRFYILEDNISEKNKKLILDLKKIKDFDIEFIKVDNSLFENCPHVEICKRITKQTYYRYLIPKIKPNLIKVLYLDCDVIVQKSLRELFEIDLEDKYCGVVQDLYIKWSPKDEIRLNVEAEFNAGVLLINNKKWRDENLTDVFFENTTKLYEQGILLWQDQDVLNYTFRNKVLWISPKYNLQENIILGSYYTMYSKDEFEYSKKHPVIIHYNYKKPNSKEITFFPFAYYKALYHTGYRKKAIELMFNNFKYRIKEKINCKKLML